MASTHNLKESIDKNKIRNCPTTIENNRIAEAIYRTHIPIIQGKSTRRSPENYKKILRIP